MRVLVCGGRDFTDQEFIYRTLDKLHKDWYIDSVIEGDARGVDRIAGQWAKRNKVDLYPCPADWNQFGKGAGFIRNQRMLDEYLPDVVVAFPGGNGTAHMVKIALEAGLQVIHVTR